MADETTTLLIDVKVSAEEAIKRQQDLKTAIDAQKTALNDLTKDKKGAELAEAKLSEEYIVAESNLKNLNSQLGANQRVLTKMQGEVVGVSGAYAALNQKSAEAAQLAKDMAVAYGSTDARTIEAVKSAKALSDQLKAVDASVGQHQRNVGDYGIATAKLPGIFGDVQTKVTSAFASINSSIEQGKKYVTDYAKALEAQKIAQEAAKEAAKLAAIAEAELVAAEKAGAASADLAAAAELRRGEATAAATVATEASASAMKILKVALASTGIGLLVVALGTLVAYFTQTNEGAKKFKQITAGLGASLQIVTKIAGEIGSVLFEAFAKPSGAVAMLSGILQQALLPLKTMFIVFNDVKNGNFGDAVKHIGSAMKDGFGNLKQIVVGAKDMVVDMGVAFSKTSTVVANASKKGVVDVALSAKKTQEDMQNITKQQRDWLVERSKLEGDYAVLVQNAGKRSRLDDAGKLQSAKDAIALKEMMYKKDLEIAKENLRLIKEEEGFKSKKDKQRIADAEIAVNRIISTHKSEYNSIENLMGKTEQRIDAANESKVKSNKAAQDKITEDEKQAEEERIKQLKENADKAIEVLNYEIEMAKLKEQERLAGQKQSDAEIHSNKLATIQRNYTDELNKLNAKLENEQIAKDEYLKAEELLNQQKNTNIAIENAAFDEAEAQRKKERQAIEAQAEFDLQQLKFQNEFDAQQNALDLEYQQKIEAAKKVGADTVALEAIYAEQSKKIAEAKKKAQLDVAASLAGNLSELFGKETNLGKAAASAQVAIQTYQGAMSAWSAAQVFPAPFNTIVGGASVAATVALGAKSVKNIWAVKAPGASGGSSSAASVSTPSASISAAANVTGGLVSRSSGQTEQAATTQAMDKALKDNNTTRTVLVTNDLTTALNEKVQLQNDNGL